MSINSVSRSLLPYGPLAAANSSPHARSAAPAHEAPEATTPRETGAPATYSTSDPVAPAESSLERALRQARVATGASTSEDANSGIGSYAPAIGLYQRVSQYNDDRSSASGLMKSWNDIVRENRFGDAGVADYVKAVAQNDTVALPSRVLDLTA